MRVILDTNVLLSALLKADTPPYQLVDAWLDGRFELVSSAAQIDEITRVARYPKVRQYIARAEIGWLVNRVQERALLVERLPKVDVSSDPGDNFLLAMAKAGSAEFLVTGDKAGVLAVEKHGNTQIVNARQMVTTLKLK
ncbi:MAG: putative toxin-antitoxin system toxin component, PIN family [Burkholderiales bacterium]